jgi:signal peptidase I
MHNFLQQAWSFIKTVSIAAFLAFFLIRGFVFEPFRIPSSSMMPNLLIGDYLVVSKFAYGNRLPLTNFFFWERPVERGDIVVFRRTGSGLPGSFFGLGPTLFIKRVVGVPGDTVAFRNQTLFINGQAISSTSVGSYALNMPQGEVQADLRTEDLLGVPHNILQIPGESGPEVAETLVPERHYVVMGDNRDNSRDSRYWQAPAWGFVPKDDIMGRAEFIVWSWNENWLPRLERVFTGLRAQHEPR